MMDRLVSTQWLANEMDSPDLRILDASYHLAGTGRDAAAEYAAGHIPGALFLDLANLKDAAAPFDNTVPDAAFFADYMGRLGVAHDDRIVLYDDSPLHSSARAWFLLTLFGARNVAILDGGLAKWKAEGRPETQDVPSPEPVRFAATFDADMLRDKAAMLANLDTRAEQVVDARGAARFTGEDPEPRPGMGSGHIPGARNLPIGMLYAEDGTMKDKAAIEAEFTAAGIDLDRPVVTSCGSGVTAAVLSLALDRIGKGDVALYDGSWSEWGSDPATPKATGRG